MRFCLAITNFVVNDPTAKQKTGAFHCYGNGAPANTDQFVTDTARFGVGSTYIDLTSLKKYTKTSIAAGTTADLSSGTGGQATFVAQVTPSNNPVTAATYADLAAARTDVAALNSAVETRLDATDTKINALLTALINAGLMAAS